MRRIRQLAILALVLPYMAGIVWYYNFLRNVGTRPLVAAWMALRWPWIIGPDLWDHIRKLKMFN